MTKETKNKEIEKLKKESQEYLEGWKRAKADFINYKKNESDIIKKEVEREKKKLLLEIIEILDIFYIAERNIKKEDMNDKNLIGLLSVKDQIDGLLKNQGVTEIKAIDEEFDPNLHEAVAVTEEEDLESNKVVEEIKKGYLIDGQLLRPAQVKVTK